MAGRFGADPGTAVAADVQERVQNIVLVTIDDHTLAADVEGLEAAWSGEV